MLPAANVGDIEFSIIVNVSRVADAGFISDDLPSVDVTPVCAQKYTFFVKANKLSVIKDWLRTLSPHEVQHYCRRSTLNLCK